MPRFETASRRKPDGMAGGARGSFGRVSETFRVRIDLARLRPRLSSQSGRDVTNGDAFLWLRSKGFSLAPGTWVAPLPALHALEPGEIVRSDRLDGLS